MATPKPFLQRWMERYTWIAAAANYLAGILGIFTNVRSLITIPVVLVMTLVTLAVYLFLSLLCRLRRIKWESDSGQMMTIVKIGRKPMYYFLGGWLFLSGIALDNFLTRPAPPAVVQAPVRHPVFNSDDPRFKILILPWKRECSYQGKDYDIGLVLQKRLSAMELKDRTALHTHYLTDSIDFSNFTDRTADSLMHFHRATMILYGSYSLKECEGGTSDKICFNYQTSGVEPALCAIDRNVGYNMVRFEGLEDIRQGQGQAEVDGIIQGALAVAEIKRRQYAAATERLRNVKGFWQDKRLLFIAGVCYNHMRDAANAERCYRGVLKLDPDHEEALMHLGATLVSAGKWSTGKRYVEKVLEKDSINISALRNMAMINLAMGDTLIARMCVERIKRQPSAGTEHVLAVIGEIHLKLRDYPLAKHFIEKSLAIHSGHADRLNNLAMVYQHLKDTTRAIRLLQKAIGIDPKDADAWYHLGAIDAKQQRLAEAHEKFQRAVTADPYHAEALASMGQSCYFFSHQKERGLEYMEKAVALAPKNAQVFGPALATYMDARLYEQVEKLLEPFTGGDSPETGLLLNSMGHMYNKHDNHRKALDCYKRSLALLPPNAASYYNLASTYSQMRNKKAALSYLRKAVAHDTTMKRYADKDMSFGWLQGSQELCQVLE